MILSNQVMETNPINRNKRIAWIDICKGITIILMVIGHIGSVPWPVRTIIFSFHMPLFIIINGLLIHNYDIKNTFSRSAKSLVIPYVVVCLLAGFIRTFIAYDTSLAGEAFFASLDDMLVGMSKTSTWYTKYGSVWVIWFVPCLFVGRNLYVLIRHVFRNQHRAVQDLVLLFLALCGYFIGTRVAFLPWSLDVAMYSLVFFMAGDYLRLHPIKKEAVVTVLALVVWIALLYKHVQIELAVRQYPYVFLGAVCAVAGSIVIMQVSKEIAKIPFISSTFSWLGKNSLVILGVHCLELRFFKWENWVYSPFGINPTFLTETVLHLVFIIVVTGCFISIRGWLREWNRRHKDDTIMLQNGKHLAWPDVAKGICIISVVFGHLEVPWLNAIVFTYHLPVFFLLAGYFLKKTDPVDFVSAKARRLLIPYAVTCIIIIVLAAIASILKKNSPIPSMLYWTNAALYAAGDSWTTPFTIRAIGAIWFLWALFISLIITNYCIERKYYQIIICIIAFVGWASFQVSNVWLPLSIQAGMLDSVYLLIGYECRKNHFSFEKIGRVPVIGLFLIMAFGIQNFKGIWLVHNYFGNGLLDFIVTLAASAVIFVLSIHIGHTNVWLTKVLSLFGKNSLVIMCAHIVDLNVLNFPKLSLKLAAVLHLTDNHRVLLLAVIRLVYVIIVAIVFNWVKRMRAKRMA